MQINVNPIYIKLYQSVCVCVILSDLAFLHQSVYTKYKFLLKRTLSCRLKLKGSYKKNHVQINSKDFAFKPTIKTCYIRSNFNFFTELKKKS